MNFYYTIKLFFRIVLKHKRHFLINVGALAICIAASTIIISYIYSQKSYDSFHEKKERIYRVINVRNYPTKIDKSAGCIEVAGPEMKATFPEVEEYAHCVRRKQIIRKDEQQYKEPNIYYTTPSFLKIFTFPFVKGNQTDYLTKPFTCLISEKMAEKYFGNEDPIGKLLDFVYEKPVQIEGIIKNVPANSYFNFDILVSYSTIHSLGYCESCNNKNTYLLLAEKADVKSLEAKFPSLIKRIHPNDEFKRDYLLQPLSDIHLTTIYRFEIGKTDSGKILSYLGLIAILILFISWFNYISVNTIISLKRLKENGVKSISGANTGNIYFQLFIDSFLVSLLATGMGCFLAFMALPAFYGLFHIDYFVIPTQAILILSGVVFIGSITTSLFPFLIFKKIKAVNVYNLFKQHKTKSAVSRTAFLIAQNVIAILLIAFSVLTYQQYKFMVDAELGFNANNLLVVNNNISQSGFKNPDKLFLEKLMAYPTVAEVGFTSYLMGSENGDVGGGFRLEGKDIDKSIQVYEVAVSGNFFDLMKIKTLVLSDELKLNSAPVFFDGNRSNDIFLNETAVKQLGFEKNEDILGKTIIREDYKLGVVAGVVNDYHQTSLDRPIQPTFYQQKNWSRYFLIKIQPGTTAETLSIIKKEYKKIAPTGLFEYYFLNDHYEKQYTSYTSFLQIILLFTLLAIIISCIGMFSLARYIILIREKEIGIRKVNGATVYGILAQLNSGLMIWVVLAFAIATPIAYFAMHKWLESYAYKTNLSWWIFAAAGVLAFGIALLTVSFQSYKAATRNPVESLRYE